MPLYSYIALDAFGEKHSGSLAADHTAQLRQELRGRGLMPLEVKAKGNVLLAQLGALLRLPVAQKKRRFSRKALQSFTQQAAILLEGGLSLEKTLNLLATQEIDPGIKAMLSEILTKIREGLTLADALAFYPDDFNPMYRTTVAAGERTGTLNEVLAYLARYIELQVGIQQKIKLALFYPSLLAVFSLFVIIFLLMFIVPDLAKAFSQSGRALPVLTQLVLAFSDLVRHHGLMLLIAGAMLAFALKRYRANPLGRHRFDAKLLRLPLVGKTVIDIELTAFVNTLAMLLQSAVPLADSMAVAKNVVGNVALKKALADATDRVCEGSALADALKDIPFIPLPLVGLVTGGEASGELNRVLQLAARQQSQKLEQRASWFLSILEPCIILATGLMILLIVLAMMMPVLTLNQLVK